MDQERRLQTVCLMIITAVALGFALFFLRGVLIPFVLAIFLVFCLTPLIEVQTKRLGFGRFVAVINTMLLGCVLIVLLGMLIWSAVQQLDENLPVYGGTTKTLVHEVTAPLEQDETAGESEAEGDSPDDLGEEGDEPADPEDAAAPGQVEAGPDEGKPGFGLAGPWLDADQVSDFIMTNANPASILRRLVGAIMSILSNGLLVVIFMIFMLAGAKREPPPEGSFRAEVRVRIQRFVVTKVLLSGVTGFLVGLTLTLFGVPLALVFGVLGFFLNFIPSIGSIIATLLPVPVVLFWPGLDLSPVAMVLAIAIPGVIQFAVGSVIEPKMMGGSLDLHPVAILLGLMFFGMIWGIVGMFLATPLVAVIKIMLDRVQLTAPVGGLLSGRFESP